ncbi:MAG: hypothetical protein GY859_01515, partial [Desulfobacterales bacterium]|nr:hypothetical protein [Desulfobacterales bacterium]
MQHDFRAIDYIKMAFASPQENEIIKNGNLELRVDVSNSLSGLTASGYELDDENTGEMSQTG